MEQKKLTIEERAKIVSRFFEFHKYIYTKTKGHFIENWHQHKICDALEKVFLGQIKNLIITIAPRTGKTELAVKHFIAWCIGIAPDCEFIHASYAKSLAANNTYETRELINHPAYKELFPHVKLKSDRSAMDHFKTSAGGTVYATGTYGAVTGFGYGKTREGFGGVGIIDDPHNVKEKSSVLQFAKTCNFYDEVFCTRANMPWSPKIIIMQRLASYDLVAHILARKSGQSYHVINIPAANDELTESFFPARFPIEGEGGLRQIKEETPHKFAAQYMQTPYIVGGNIIKTGQFKFYKILPQLRYRIILADTAQKTKEHNDYSVFACWGMGTDNKIYLVDLIRGKWEAPELERRAIAFVSKHKNLNTESGYGMLRNLQIEDKASGTGLIQSIKQKIQIPVVSIQRSIDKYSRAMDVLGYIESGYVYLPEEAPFVSDFLDECAQFTADNSHKHDDQVDVLIDAITILLSKTNTAELWKQAL